VNGGRTPAQAGVDAPASVEENKRHVDLMPAERPARYAGQHLSVRGIPHVAEEIPEYWVLGASQGKTTTIAVQARLPSSAWVRKPGFYVRRDSTIGRR
jgi:hypothetical protein